MLNMDNHTREMGISKTPNLQKYLDPLPFLNLSMKERRDGVEAKT